MNESRSNIDDSSSGSGGANCRVNVCCRIRPSSNPRQTSVVTLTSKDNSVNVRNLERGTITSFRFDSAFGESSTDSEIFESHVRPIVDSFVAGYNGTVMAYGQTGSGKTYTIGRVLDGENPEFTESRGLVQFAVRRVFELLSMDDVIDTHSKISVSYTEIYDEAMKDLLAEASVNVHGEVSLNNSGCVEFSVELPPNRHAKLSSSRHTTLVHVGSAARALEVIRLGGERRSVASTGMNEKSSRSHAVVTLHLRKTLPSSSRAVVSTLSFVDLAGSERNKRTGNVGQRFKESVSINSGLLALGNVITALANRSSYVPYRDSALTRCLSEALGGNSRTLLIACVSPEAIDAPESCNTLSYATRGRRIVNYSAKVLLDGSGERVQERKAVESNDVLELVSLIAGLSTLSRNGRVEGSEGDALTDSWTDAVLEKINSMLVVTLSKETLIESVIAGCEKAASEINENAKILDVCDQPPSATASASRPGPASLTRCKSQTRLGEVQKEASQPGSQSLTPESTSALMSNGSALAGYGSALAGNGSAPVGESSDVSGPNIVSLSVARSSRGLIQRYAQRIQELENRSSELERTVKRDESAFELLRAENEKLRQVVLSGGEGGKAVPLCGESAQLISEIVCSKKQQLTELKALITAILPPQGDDAHNYVSDGSNDNSLGSNDSSLGSNYNSLTPEQVSLSMMAEQLEREIEAYELAVNSKPSRSVSSNNSRLATPLSARRLTLLDPKNAPGADSNHVGEHLTSRRSASIEALRASPALGASPALSASPGLYTSTGLSVHPPHQSARSPSPATDVESLQRQLDNLRKFMTRHLGVKEVKVSKKRLEPAQLETGEFSGENSRLGQNALDEN